jgi:periplasmic divalent cation tolerance protein
MTKFDWVYMTVGTLEEAKIIGRTLVESKLAACVNILEPMIAIYEWDGEIREEREVVVIAKTVNTKVSDLITKVKSIHSDECPCILALPVVDGNMGFLSWIDRQTG